MMQARGRARPRAAAGRRAAHRRAAEHRPASHEVRGLGLLLAAELDDGSTRRSSADAALEAGLVVNAVTPSALRLAPPLLVTDDEIDEAVAILAQVLVRPRMTRHFLEIDDLTADELATVLDLRRAADRTLPQVLAGHGVALVFEKPSARTRNSMEMAVVQLGGHPVTIRGDEVGLDVRESVEDITRTLAGYHAVIAARVFEHAKLERMAAVAAVPVVNLLSDDAHPMPGAGRPAHDPPALRRARGPHGRLRRRRQQRGCRSLALAARARRAWRCASPRPPATSSERRRPAGTLTAVDPVTTGR